MANTTFTVTFELLDLDGHGVVPAGGIEPLVITAETTVAPNTGAKRGQKLNSPFAIVMGPLPIPAGQYEWRLKVNGNGKSRWSLPFATATGVELQS
jgi:hypothetical protein